MADDAGRASRGARGSRRRAIVLAVLWATVSGAVLAASGCYGHNCDSDIGFYGRNPGEGRMITPDTWESGPVDGDWLWFPRQRVWVMQIPGLGNRTPYLVEPFVSAQKNPNLEGNSTLGSGNIAEISAVANGSVTIHNGTCADYYLRVVVTAPPLPAPDGGADAATAPITDDDAGSDAGADLDASADADADASP